MSRLSETQIAPRNGKVVQVGIIARISGCRGQKEVSLEDQVDHGKEEVGHLYKGAVNYQIIATKGKGERLDRPELVEIEQLFRSKKLDLCIMEDIGRLVRGTEAVRLLGIAVDHGTRVIAPNDCVDTAEEHWEEDVMSACRDHTSHQTHTSKRIKKKQMARFLRAGQVTPQPIAGYIKPKDAKSFADWFKDESATQTIQRGLELLSQTLNGSAVADLFNEQNFPIGIARRKKKKWDGTMALAYYRNPILKGMPARGSKHSIKHFESGRRLLVRNPKGPNYRHEPHLAHVDPVQLDEVLARVQQKNEQFSRTAKRRQDARLRVPRKRTRSFGQHAQCWYCGRHYVWGGHGIAENLMCSGSREYKCWNSIGFKGPLAAEKLVDAITARLELIDGVDEQFRALVARAQQAGVGGLEGRWDKLRKEEEKLARKERNAMDALAEYGPSELIKKTLMELEQSKQSLIAERHYLESVGERTVKLPESTAAVRSILKTEFTRLAIDSYEFGDFIRSIVPEFQVYLVRHIRGGHLLSRAKVRLNLLGSFTEIALVPGLRELLSEEFTLDLFTPTRPERIRLEVAALAAQGLNQRDIADRLSETVFQVEVWHALKWHRIMLERGLSEPYVVVTDPPDDYTKLKRHKNRNYRFEPFEGYERSTG